MKTLRIYGFTLLIFSILALVVFSCALGPDNVFVGSDSNIGLLMSAHNRLPLGFFGYYLSSPVFGGAGCIPFSISNAGKAFLDPEFFSNVSYAFYLVVSSLALVAYLRSWKLRLSSCIFGALTAFWVGSVTLSAAGHINKLSVMAFFTIGLYLSEKCVRSQGKACGTWSSLLGLVVGLMLLEQQDVGLLAGLFLGAYVVFRIIYIHGNNWKKWILILIPISVIGGGISCATAVRAYDANVTQTGINKSSSEKWDYITQWSFVPSELPDLIAPGRTGWKTGDPSGPYWGVCGQSNQWKVSGQGFRNFKLDSSYIGVVPIFVGILGLFLVVMSPKSEQKRVHLFWFAAGVVALFLAFGKFSPLYKVFYQLPLVNTIRVPQKFMHNFQVFIGILSAFGLDRLVDLNADADADRKKLKGIIGSCIAMLLLMVVLALSAGSDAVLADFSEWGDHAAVITKNIGRAWGHAAVMTSLLAGVFFLLLRNVPWAKNIVPFLLCVCVMYDSVFLTRKYFEAMDISALKKGNVVFDFLKKNQGDERIYFLRQDGPYARWISMESQYYGLNRFNIWQMPRMPSEYKEFLGAAGENPVRLWQLASIRYITAPAGVLGQLQKDKTLAELIKPVMFYRFTMKDNQLHVAQICQPALQQDQVLLELDTIPRFSLFNHWEQVDGEKQCNRLFSPDFDPYRTVLIDRDVSVRASPKSDRFLKVTAETSLNDAVVKTVSAKNGVLMFTQRFQSGWKVFVDGNQAELLKCNYLSMGVMVPVGEHEVRFVFD